VVSSELRCPSNACGQLGVQAGERPALSVVGAGKLLVQVHSTPDWSTAAARFGPYLAARASIPRCCMALVRRRCHLSSRDPFDAEHVKPARRGAGSHKFARPPEPLLEAGKLNSPFGRADHTPGPVNEMPPLLGVAPLTTTSGLFSHRAFIGRVRWPGDGGQAPVYAWSKGRGQAAKASGHGTIVSLFFCGPASRDCPNCPPPPPPPPKSIFFSPRMTETVSGPRIAAAGSSCFWRDHKKPIRPEPSNGRTRPRPGHNNDMDRETARPHPNAIPLKRERGRLNKINK